MRRLTKEDFSMLPAWVGQNEQTISFFEWLMQEDLTPWNCKDIVLVKVKQILSLPASSGGRTADYMI